MISKARLLGIVIPCTVLPILAVIVFLMTTFRMNLNKDSPVPDLRDEEVRGLLDALRLDNETEVSALRAVFLRDGGDITMAVRLRIDGARLDELVRGSWMELHRVGGPEFPQYRMMLPPMYEIDWWDALPIRNGEETFYLRLEQSQSYSGLIMAVVRKRGSHVDLYFVRASCVEYYPPGVVETMERGRSPDPGFSSQTHMYEVKKGEFGGE